jgi:hypothetical protein
MHQVNNRFPLSTLNPRIQLKIQETLSFNTFQPQTETQTNMPDQKDKAQEKNRIERLQEEQGDTDPNTLAVLVLLVVTPAQANRVHQKFPLVVHLMMLTISMRISN